MSIKIRICFIGDGSHAKRIKRSLSNLQVNYLCINFDRNKSLINQPDILSCDAVFLTSPNNTHADYLDQLNKSYSGYIYCEKPPINEFDQIGIFDKINYKKCFFGFNYRYSKINSFVKNIKKNYHLGCPINMSIHVSYPFAIKQAYKDSWKSKINCSPQGVVENLAIHYIDMSLEIFGKFKKIHTVLNNITKVTKVDDTAKLFIEHENSSTTDIFVSYSTSVKDEIYITFENGDIQYDGSEINFYYPKNSFGDNGLAVRPPIIAKDKINGDQIYDSSMDNCVNEFISKVIDKGFFDRKVFESTRISTLAMFQVL
jgi:predicted dehydrogenase